ncbi:RxLR-like protein [Plasmopara halstedii]|uniref:RxLR-like protein n=1 Tax=Plasmopara halstedii TaxID=4781 RepID=A0A0P1AR47_PLAHL|nr:RxLR-like protein [Plasmopara halstedii]CEG43348.1 RxLR-like protein [Plasmopara halstedii]|eukprot:XP_024579717.1 RxLR-like protein [Plasmopara halstedii]
MAMALVATLLLLFSRSVISQWIAKEIYDRNNCSGVPVVVNFDQGTRCLNRQCMLVEVNNATQFIHDVCNISNGFEYARKIFDEENCIVIEDYIGVGCENLHTTRVVTTSGKCTHAGVFGSYSIISELFSNGSASIQLFADINCEGNAYMSLLLDSGNIKSGDCVDNYYRFYTRGSESVLGLGAGVDLDHSPSINKSMSTTALISTVIAAGVVGFVTAIFLWKRIYPRAELRSNDLDGSVSCMDYTPMSDRQMSVSMETNTRSSSSATEKQQQGISYFWNDLEIAAARVDREKIEFEQVISYGGYGQVISGWFNGQHVAIKMLQPEHRKSMKCLNSFLEEVKLMSILEHPRIVHFVGVAWDSLSDLCLLTTFMEGGDLRALLESYESQNMPVGYDVTKVTIALHIAHALTYLHSFDPPVLHRDLKSKNILLSDTLDARLSDFGVSRENAESTMTAGVGTSHWMAPEMMLGERYDDKADVFSMGVVLSELDLHALPYALATNENDSSHKIPSSAIINLVTMGQLRVKFSSINSVSNLGLACVAVNPHDRPTAAEVLFKLHTVLTDEYGRRGEM